MAVNPINLDPKNLKDYWNLVEEKVLQYTGNSDGAQLEAAVKSLGEQLELDLNKKGLRLHFMIFNLEQPYHKSLKGWSDFKEEFIYNRRFGIWLFEEGTFENTGIGSYQNWKFGGYNGGNWKRGGEPVQLFYKFPFGTQYGQGRLVTFSKIES